MDQNIRAVIPVLVYRLQRCSAKDVNVLQYFFDLYDKASRSYGLSKGSEDEELYYSEMLYGLVVYSELWERPSPSFNDLVQVFEGGLMGGNTYDMVIDYCIFDGRRDKTCSGIAGPASAPFVYKR